ncbi:MAG: peptidylprolyl isomerase [Aquisalimonadaceae bacterium]
MKYRIVRTMRNSLLTALASLLLATGGALANQPLDRIVALVNDDIILESELRAEISTVQQQYQGGNLPRGQDLQRQVMDRLIMKRLQLSQAERMGITVDDNTLNAAVRRVAQQNNMNLPQLQQALQQQGIAFARFRDDLRDDIIINRLHQREVERQVDVSQQEIEEFLASPAGAEDMEFRVAHILISTPDAASAEDITAAQSRAEESLAEIRAGTDFAEVAARVSDGQQALDGGDLGWRSAGQIPTVFAEDVLSMTPGEISDVIRSSSGFHVVKLVDSRSAENRIVNQTRARHILIRTSEVVTDNDARTRLESLLERIEQGEDFATLARSHSDDRGSASTGGDLNWVNPGQLVPAFERVMDSLEPGQISEPFETPFGWHVVEVLDRRQHDGTDDYRRTRAANEIRERKGDEVLENWLRRIRDEAYIENRLES